MNERIRELAEQCYETGPIGKDGWPEYSKFNEEKFAELIVRECIQEIENKSMNSNDEWEYGLRMAQAAIQEHFGVEE